MRVARSALLLDSLLDPSLPVPPSRDCRFPPLPPIPYPPPPSSVSWPSPCPGEPLPHRHADPHSRGHSSAAGPPVVLRAHIRRSAAVQGGHGQEVSEGIHKVMQGEGWWNGEWMKPVWPVTPAAHFPAGPRSCTLSFTAFYMDSHSRFNIFMLCELTALPIFCCLPLNLAGTRTSQVPCSKSAANHPLVGSSLATPRPLGPSSPATSIATATTSPTPSTDMPTEGWTGQAHGRA